MAIRRYYGIQNMDHMEMVGMGLFEQVVEILLVDLQEYRVINSRSISQNYSNLYNPYVELGSRMKTRLQ